jgi:beta-glucosidase
MTGRTYRYFTGNPLYAFGHGLSYSTFKYAGLQTEPRVCRPGDVVTVSTTVANSGDRYGDEVVQVYVRHTAPGTGCPLRQLKAFRRVAIQAGERCTLTFELPVNEWAYWDEGVHGWVVQRGEYEIEIGGASDRIQLRGRVMVDLGAGEQR